MHITLIAVIVLLLILFAPQWWTRRVLARYSKEQDHFQGTGGELARHLLDRFAMPEVKVDSTDQGDHYDPLEKVVRLGEDKINAKSLTAIAVAAHEVGHAIQHHEGYAPLAMRTSLVRWVLWTEKLGSALMLVTPVLAIISRSPVVGGLVLLAGVASLGLGVIVHLVTLPVEWDASFRRALPILEQGYISPAEQKQARRILTAAALTYVAGSLAGLLNLWRWLALLRR
ncbi:MAG: zinc metallopeptidase [Gammaproteobacteria bacterium]|nr:MAG: zinc metallopeptidase [Gammaproteobacteria bacterium]